MLTSKSEFEIEISVTHCSKSNSKYISVRSWNESDWRHRFNGCFDVAVDLETGDLTVKKEYPGEDGPGCYSFPMAFDEAIEMIEFFSLDELI